MAGRNRFGSTWWGGAWVDALEHAGSGYDSQLPRGRTYARKGAVRQIDLQPGHIAARVVGSNGELHRVDIEVRQLAMSEWEQVADSIGMRAAHLAALLDGELHPGIVEDAAEVDVRLLPRAADLRPDCSCPDWAEPCKHAAAVCYVAAEELDRNPFALFLLRGIGRDELIDLVRSRRVDAPTGDEGPGELATGDDPVEPDGVDATQVWGRRTLADALDPAPAAATQIPTITSLPRPGRHAPWGAELPARFEIDTVRVDELAEDAIERAWAMLIDDQPSGLIAGARADLARRAALHPDRLIALSNQAGVTVGRLRSWAEAWFVGGDPAVTVLADPDSWSRDQTALDAGREQLVELGHPRRSVALNYDSLLMSSTLWLVIGPDGRWYRLRGAGKHQDLRLTDPPAADIRDLVEPA